MRSALRAVVVLASSIVLLPAGARAQSGDAVGFDIAWNHVALSVPSIAESIAWYEKMLGFKGTVRGGQPGARQQVADLRRGNITIELFQVADAAPLPESRKNPSEDFRTHGVKHFGFEVKNLAAVLAEIEGQGREDGLRDARHADRGLRLHQRQRRQCDRADRAQDAVERETVLPATPANLNSETRLFDSPLREQRRCYHARER